jgi:hypothetical protein
MKKIVYIEEFFTITKLIKGPATEARFPLLGE